MRLRSTFSKTEAMRFTGHLDLHRTLERTMRRANLPLAYSEGFNPRPKITLASALPLGFTSEGEVVDFWLKEALPIKDISMALVKASPPGIIFHQFEEVGLRDPKLQTTILSATFTVTLLEPLENFEDKVSTILEAEDIPRSKTRKGKTRTYNLRHLILDMQALPENEHGQQQLEMTLQAKEGATGRPDEVLEELGANPLAAKIHRKRIVFGG
jgi:radical SAM-linked protein